MVHPLLSRHLLWLPTPQTTTSCTHICMCHHHVDTSEYASCCFNLPSILLMQRPAVSELVKMTYKGYDHFDASQYPDTLEKLQELLHLIPIMAVEDKEDAELVMGLVHHSRSDLALHFLHTLCLALQSVPSQSVNMDHRRGQQSWHQLSVPSLHFKPCSTVCHVCRIMCHVCSTMCHVCSTMCHSYSCLVSPAPLTRQHKLGPFQTLLETSLWRFL